MTEPASTPDPFNLAGQTIDGKYRVSSVIGDGGFGVVYRGVHKGFGELIAIKCLKLPQSLDEAARDGFLEQLREEGRLLHRLSKATSGIVQALDVGAFVTTEGVWVPYLVLEWLEGKTLSEHLRERADQGLGPYGLAEAMRLLDPAVRALAVAHQQKVAHRDVKPPNLFVVTAGGQTTLKVLDFGIAKVLTDHPTFTEALAATKLGPTAFTPRYGAPEQFNKQRGATGPWTDVFALALILVELMTGRKALEGDDPTQLYIAAADPMSRPTPRARGAAVSDAVERVLERALHVEPKHRYHDAGEFWEALVGAASAAGEARERERRSRDIPITAPSDWLETAQPTGLGQATSPPVGLGARGGAGGDPTLPAEASRPGVGAPAVVVNAPLAAGAQGAHGATGRGPGDPMAETPYLARNADAAGVAGAAGSGGAAGAPDKRSAAALLAVPPTPPAVETPVPPRVEAKAAGSRLPWIVGAVAVLAAGGAAFAWLGGGENKPTGAPSKPVSSAAPRAVTGANAGAKAASTATAGPAESASAAPAAPEPPPEDMVLIPAGSFTMGDGAGARPVTITRPFYIDRQEVTTRAYDMCVEQRKCSAADHVSVTPDVPGSEGALPAETSEFVKTWTPRCNENRKAADHPINCVDYASAEAYCLFKGRRLPTEAEWELSARGREGRAFPWGSEAPSCERACYDKNGACRSPAEVVATCAVGLHPADRTPEGLFDMAGGVSEWVSDGYAEHPAGGADPKGDPAAPLRVTRGGNFLEDAAWLGGSFRQPAAPVAAHVSIGFRCAKDGPQP